MTDGKQPGPMTYADAGVDRDAANAAKERISELVRGTYTDGVHGDYGSFGGCFRLAPGASGRLLVASADGVGTKLKVAVMAGVHDTVGYDLVAHCADDILTQGALPLFFLDYLALGTMEAGTVEAIVGGVARACRDVGAALLGGETAEMPDMYAPGEFDLAGFIVGQTIGDAPLDGAAIEAGDVLLGLGSDGLHTNGYSLARRILFERASLDVDTHMPDWGCTIGEELLRPHRSYIAPLRPALERGEICGLAHITGGGIPENVPRMFSEGLGARVDRSAWTMPPVFATLQDLGDVPEADMWRTFNMGIGMVAAVARGDVDRLHAEIDAAGERVVIIGEVIEGEGVSW